MASGAKQEINNCSVIGCDFAQGGEAHGKNPRCLLELPGGQAKQIEKIRRLCGKMKAQEAQRTQEVHNE